MLHSIWEIFLYKPLLNALAFLVSVVPGGDVGLAVIALTVLVKLLLFPISQKALESQAKMAELAPEINRIKQSGATQEVIAKLTFDLYKKHRINPFYGCLMQIPIILIFISLYFVFLKGLNFQPEYLYSFVSMPENINVLFLGLIDISSKSFFLAAAAGASQYLQARMMPKPEAATEKEKESFQHNLNKSMHMQMKYIFPFLIFFILYTDFFGISASGAVALYWITSNLFTVGQQIYANRKKEKLALS